MKDFLFPFFPQSKVFFLNRLVIYQFLIIKSLFEIILMKTKIEAKFKKEFELNTDILCSNMTHFWQTPGFDDKICWTLFSLLTWCADVGGKERETLVYLML